MPKSIVAIQWHPMIESPPKELADDEVLLFVWHDGLCARVDAWSADEWGTVLPEPEVELYAWAVIQVPAGTDAAASAGHVEGVDG